MDLGKSKSHLYDSVPEPTLDPSGSDYRTTSVSNVYIKPQLSPRSISPVPQPNFQDSSNGRN